jgi:YidC/Oxa1 family membrane protein insertase
VRQVKQFNRLAGSGELVHLPAGRGRAGKTASRLAGNFFTCRTSRQGQRAIQVRRNSTRADGLETGPTFTYPNRNASWRLSVAGVDHPDCFGKREAASGGSSRAGDHRKPGMQNKNFVLFMVTCIVIIMSWFWIQHQLWPPRLPDRKQVEKKDDDGPVKDKLKKDAAFRKVFSVNVAVNRLGARHPLTALVNVHTEVNLADKELIPPILVAEADLKPATKPAPKKEPEPQLPIERYTLGGADAHITAVLTTKGAGIEKLSLNRFEAADYLGQPTGRTLELIQQDPFQPSFLMYHYEGVDDDRPLQTLGDRVWKFEEQTKTEDGVEEVSFSTRLPGRTHIKITKTYRLDPREYHLTLRLEFERNDEAGRDDLPLRYQLAGAHGLPVEGEWYTAVFRNGVIGQWDPGNKTLDRTMADAFTISQKQGGDRVPEAARRETMIQYAAAMNQYFASAIVVDNGQPEARDGGVDRKGILAWARPTLETTEKVGVLREVNEDTVLFAEKDAVGRYHILPHVKQHIDETNLKANERCVLSYYETSDGKRVATWIRQGQTPRPYMDDITVRVVSEPITLARGEKVAHQFMLYNGPAKVRLLGQFAHTGAVDPKLVDRYADTLHLNTLTDYGSLTFFQKIGWTRLLIWTTSLMHWLLYWLSFITFGSSGLSIILLTVIVRGLMFPISKKQAQFSIKMQELAPELKKVNEKYKNDPQAKTQATMDLYRKHKVHPLGGCLPIFLQMPIFLGLYYALMESIHFRLAPFLWIDNLAAPDMLIWWTESIPLISSPDNQSHVSTGFLDALAGMLYLGPFFNILPILAVTFMFFQQKLMMPPPTSDEQAMQQKMMQYMMIFMGVLFYKVASGLCIYFIASTAWGLAERKLLPKKKPDQPPPPVSGKGASRGKPKPDPKTNGDGPVDKVKDWWAKLLEDARKK